MERSFFSRSPEGMSEVAAALLRDFPQPTIFLLMGEMGAGKTTFTHALCAALGIEGVSSPTFSLVNEYVSAAGVKVFHFDLYRLRKAEELLDIGFEEYLEQNAYVVIEWPQLAADFLRGEGIEVHLSVENEGRRVRWIREERTI